MSLTLLLFVAILSLFSCTPRKKLIYFQTEASAFEAAQLSLEKYQLRPGDMLFIRIQTLDENTHRLFNAEWGRAATQRTSEIPLFFDSHIIDQDGNINLPLLDKIKVKGLSTKEAEEAVQKQIDEFLFEATVIIRLANFKVTVLGEVNRPGTYKVYDSHFTLLEAISAAGDLTVFGNRQNIMVLRKSDNNKIQRLDITDINVINSEFFYLQPHDVVYIEPLKAKSLGFREFPFSILFSSITTVLVLINFISN